MHAMSQLPTVAQALCATIVCWHGAADTSAAFHTKACTFPFHPDSHFYDNCQMCSPSLERCSEEDLLMRERPGVLRPRSCRDNGSPSDVNRLPFSSSHKPEESSTQSALSQTKEVPLAHVPTVGPRPPQSAQPPKALCEGVYRVAEGSPPTSIRARARPKSAPPRPFAAWPDHRIQVGSEWQARSAICPVGVEERLQLQVSLGLTEKQRRSRPASAQPRSGKGSAHCLCAEGVPTQRPQSAGPAVMHKVGGLDECAWAAGKPGGGNSSITRFQRLAPARVRPRHYGTSCGRAMDRFM
jgi:hypothetical protein